MFLPLKKPLLKLQKQGRDGLSVKEDYVKPHSDLPRYMHNSGKMLVPNSFVDLQEKAPLMQGSKSSWASDKQTYYIKYD